MNKQETLANLTDLERTIIINMFEEGFATDNPNDRFMSWGVDGKAERGALASLVKKGIVTVEDWGDDKPVFLTQDYTKRDVLAVTKELGSAWIKKFAEEIGC